MNDGSIKSFERKAGSEAYRKTFNSDFVHKNMQVVNPNPVFISKYPLNQGVKSGARKVFAHELVFNQPVQMQLNQQPVSI